MPCIRTDFNDDVAWMRLTQSVKPKLRVVFEYISDIKYKDATIESIHKDFPCNGTEPVMIADTQGLNRDNVIILDPRYPQYIRCKYEHVGLYAHIIAMSGIGMYILSLNEYSEIDTSKRNR